MHYGEKNPAGNDVGHESVKGREWEKVLLQHFSEPKLL